MEFSKRLLLLRRESNLTQEELSNNLNAKYNLGTNKGVISKYEKGLHIPGFTFVDYVADYFGVTTDYLMGRSDNKYYDDGIHEKRIPVLKKLNIDPLFSHENYSSFEYDANCDFCIVMKDDSMINARIHDKDILFIKKQAEVNDGEIAVILMGGKELIRKVYKVNGNIILHAGNPAYKDIALSKKDFKGAKVLGVVKYIKARIG